MNNNENITETIRRLYCDCIEHCEFEEVSNNEGVDLFDYFECLPKEVTNILLTFNNDKDHYFEAMRVRDELQTQGYTFDYGLDGCPFNLRKL